MDNALILLELVMLEYTLVEPRNCRHIVEVLIHSFRIADAVISDIVLSATNTSLLGMARHRQNVDYCVISSIFGPPEWLSLEQL